MNYKDISRLTNRSVSTVKKWKKKIEYMAGYSFTHYSKRTRDGDIDIPDFTEEECQKFIKLANEITKTNNLDASIEKIWGGELKVRRENLESEVDKLWDYILELRNSIYDFKGNYEVEKKGLIERVEKLESKQAESLSSKSRFGFR